MARRGLFEKIQPPPGQVTTDLIGRMQDNVAKAMEQLTADDDHIRAPVVRLNSSAAIPAGTSVVIYGGGPGAVLTLPPANAQGPNVATVLFVVNVSGSAVTVASTGADLVNGAASVSVGAGALATLVSDGAS